MNFENVLAVIPARAGSKGIPRKNIKPLNGLPLVVYSIRQALECIPPRNIIVSSDDDQILALAKTWRVVAHKRPAEICGDHSSTELALLDAAQTRPDCEHILTLQPTSPIRLKGRVEQCLTHYLEGGYDSLLTTSKFYKFFWFKKDDEWNATYDYINRPMRQSLPEDHIYHFDNGNLYISRREVLEAGNRLGGKIAVYPIEYVEGLQIDTPEEFKIAEKIVSTSLLLMKVEKKDGSM